MSPSLNSVHQCTPRQSVEIIIIIKKQYYMYGHVMYKLTPADLSEGILSPQQQTHSNSLSSHSSTNFKAALS